MKASPASSLPKGKEGFDLFHGLNLARRRGRTISVHPWCLTSLKGAEGLPHLCWVSILEERPALDVPSAPKCFGTKSHFGAQAQLFILEEGASQRNPLTPAQGQNGRILTYSGIWYRG